MKNAPHNRERHFAAVREEPDPEHPGQMKAWIEQQEITYLNIRQQKTGATLMYLAGIDVYDIIKVTGHSFPNMLKNYFKAESEFYCP